MIPKIWGFNVRARVLSKVIRCFNSLEMPLNSVNLLIKMKISNIRIKISLKKSNKVIQKWIIASVNGFCERQPGLVFPSFTNCAQFYECGRYNNKTGTYLHECAYPLLYDIDSKTCQYFTNVNCGERNVPQAPC